MTDTLTEAKRLLDGITPGEWEADQGFRDEWSGGGHITVEDGTGSVIGPKASVYSWSRYGSMELE